MENTEFTYCIASEDIEIRQFRMQSCLNSRIESLSSTRHTTNRTEDPYCYLIKTSVELKTLQFCARQAAYYYWQ